MTGSAKQSSFVASIMDCFVASAFRLRSASFGGRSRSSSYGGQVAPRNDGEKWTDLPDGQISRRFPVQPPLKKYFA
jgi:hypothetical protein